MLNNFPWIWWGIDASLLLNVERKDDDLRHLVAASWSDLGKGSEIIYISSALGAPQDPSMRRSCWIQGCLILVSYGMQGNPDNSPAQYLRLKTSTDICNADFITNLTNSLNLVLKGNGNRQGFGPKHSVVMFWINHSHRLPLQWKHTLSPTLSGGLTGSSWQCWGGGGLVSVSFDASYFKVWLLETRRKRQTQMSCELLWYRVIYAYVHSYSILSKEAKCWIQRLAGPLWPSRELNPSLGEIPLPIWFSHLYSFVSARQWNLQAQRNGACLYLEPKQSWHFSVFLRVTFSAPVFYFGNERMSPQNAAAEVCVPAPRL